jgi:D-alanyl-D-alanine carboxypeptidase
MTTTVTSPAYPGYGARAGHLQLRNPCGTAWGHEGGIPGYVSIAVTDRAGLRSAVVLMSTEPDAAIDAAYQAAVTTAVCEMFERELSVASGAASGSNMAVR